MVCIHPKGALVVQSKRCSGKLGAATIASVQNRLKLTSGPQGPAGLTGSQGAAGISARKLKTETSGNDTIAAQGTKTLIDPMVDPAHD